MAGNRVEELESKVRELEATVNGLTDELVETKERLRLVEDHIGTDELDGIIEGRASRAQARDRVAQQQQKQASQTAQQPGTQEAVEEAVEQTAPDESEAAADGGKDSEAEGDDESADQSDDIIVA